MERRGCPHAIDPVARLRHTGQSLSKDLIGKAGSRCSREPLPQNASDGVQAFLDSSGEGGVVYVSLGTVCSIGAEEFRELAAALSGLPAHVVWKASEDDMPAGMHLGSLGLGSNVKVIFVAVFRSRVN